MQADGHPLQDNEHESIEIAANHASVSEEDIKPKIRGHSRLFTVLKCSKCNKRFRNPSLLQQHVKLHRGSTLYRCRQCRENFRELNKFLEHRLVHPPSRKRRRTLESNGFQLGKFGCFSLFKVFVVMWPKPKRKCFIACKAINCFRLNFTSSHRITRITCILHIRQAIVSFVDGTTNVF